MTLSAADRAILAFPDIMGLVESRCIPEPNTGCWLWECVTTTAGYPSHQAKIGDRWASFGVHRAVLAHKIGRLPKVTRHACATSLCCNPEHLLDGTQKDNVADYWAARAGRKITLSQARQIRQSAESGGALARRCGISKNMVWRIKHGKAWARLSAVGD